MSENGAGARQEGTDGEKRKRDISIVVKFLLSGHVMSCSIGSAFKSLTSIHVLCSACEKASLFFFGKRLSYFFASKPRGKIIMMRDADVNNGV